MTTISSSDIRYIEKLNAAKTFFGDKSLVSRQEILNFQEVSGTSMPAKFWTLARVGRGMFSLDVQQEPVEVTSNVIPMPPAVQTQEKVNTKFDKDSLIPKVKDTFVEWGNYKTVETLLKSNEFFTLYITGDSGSGKNEMVAQACAKLNRPLVRVSMNRETKEEHLIGSKTLVDGTIVYEEGPVVWAAENGAVLLIDEISCLHESQTVRIGTTDEWKEVILSDMEIGKPYPMVSFNQETKEFESDVGMIIKDSEKDLYEVELEDGRTVILTSDHPFICSDESGNVFELSIDEGLKEGDFVVVSCDSMNK
jgi:hypothetical protein